MKMQMQQGLVVMQEHTPLCTRYSNFSKLVDDGFPKKGLRNTKPIKLKVNTVLSDHNKCEGNDFLLCIPTGD